jgi:putative Ca2+/H+ antiporter (TMEM165/GDT1 family)
MDWQLLGLSFVTVFLAELGDKSQLAAIAISGNSKYPKAVFVGAVAALILTSFLGVIAGGGVAQFLPTKIMKTIAAIGFVILSLRILWPALEEK